MLLPCLLVSLYVTVTHCIIVTAVIVNTPVCHCQLYNCVIYTECFYHHIMVSLSQWDSDSKLGAQDLSLNVSPVFVCV